MRTIKQQIETCSEGRKNTVNYLNELLVDRSKDNSFMIKLCQSSIEHFDYNLEHLARGIPIQIPKHMLNNLLFELG